MTTDHAAAIAAAEARLAAAKAEVEDLRARLATEQAAAFTEPAGPRLATAQDGIAAARRRHPGRTRSELAAAGTSTTSDADATDITSVEGARREARRRAALRRPAGGAA